MKEERKKLRRRIVQARNDIVREEAHIKNYQNIIKESNNKTKEEKLKITEAHRDIFYHQKMLEYYQYIVIDMNKEEKQLKLNWCMGGINGHYTKKKVAEITDGLILCAHCEEHEVL